MFYGKSGGDFGPNGKRNDRFEQMTKQQQLIEQKKREIQSRLEAERQKKAVEEMMKESSQVGMVSSSTAVGPGSTSTSSTSSNKQRNNDRTGRDGGAKDAKCNVFANDGSFLAQFRQMQEEQMKKKEEEEAKNVKVKEEPASFVDEYGGVLPNAKIVKPSIKIINPEALNRSSSPSTSTGGGGGGSSSTNVQNQQGKNTSSASVPPPNFYHQAPPPPPPPPPPIYHHERKYDSPQMLERKPFISGGYQNVPPPPPPPPPQQPPSQQSQQQSSNYGSFPSPAVKHLAQRVAEGGFEVEEMARVANKDDPLMWFLYKPESAEYRRFRELISHIKSENNFNQNYNSPHRQDRSEYGGGNGGNNSNNGSSGLKRQNSSVSSGDEDEEKDRREKKRRSRWGPQSGLAQPPAVATVVPTPQVMNTVSQFSAVPPPPPPPPQVKQESFEKYEMSEYGPSPSIPSMPPNNPMAMGLPPQIKSEFPWAGAGPSRFNAPPPPPPPPPPQQQQQQQQQQPMLFPPGINIPPAVGFGVGTIANVPSGPPPIISKITRSNPQLLAYARQSYGTVDLDEEQWKQCEEAYKMNLIFQDIARKKARDEKLEKAGKFKHEYDSDEELDDGGTWEHKQRMKEMEKTRQWADELTSKAKGKHHIGDFLPPDELTKFMEKYKAVKEGRQMDESEYQEFKIAQDNIGFKMLQKMGWNDGQGLGSEGQGITAPVDKGNTVGDKQGLGVEKNDLSEEDDEYTAYRKRMMLAYRFRPNPLNNPRRAYY